MNIDTYLYFDIFRSLCLSWFVHAEFSCWPVKQKQEGKPCSSEKKRNYTPSLSNATEAVDSVQKETANTQYQISAWMSSVKLYFIIIFKKGMESMIFLISRFHLSSEQKPSQ